MTTPNNGGAAKEVAAMERRDRRIADSWNRHNTDDVSTPRLLQMVQDDTGCDVSRVISGLVRVGILKSREPQS